ncbi:GntR family transcriptional regulator [Nocardioides insulae]|uniref:GntR family transcriptional regulator n=1 Tax=Nocardioides insulae TaxID=394734 RepID=UPI00146E746C|nr:GntR family transcriptional regulator [Nocardioides insulae]
MSAGEVAAGILDASARGIAEHLADLIRAGRLPNGTRLPTVRALAATLHVGATTVATAWAVLHRDRLIRSDGRNGTFVRDLSPVLDRSAGALLDLTGFEHPAELVPDLSPFLTRAADELGRGHVGGVEVDDVLGNLLRETWPFLPGSTAVTWSYAETLAHLAAGTVRAGDRVVVEEACSPETAAVLAPLHVQLIHVACDAAGMLPDELERALSSRPAMVIIQPRYADPLAHRMTEARARQLAVVLAKTDVLVVEQDCATALATSEGVSVGRHLPDRTVLVRDLRRAYGPRVRVALVGGASPVVERIRHRQELLGSFLAPIAQRAVASMLIDPVVSDLVAASRWRFARRWHVLARSVRALGLEVSGSGGLALWVGVPAAEQVVSRLHEGGVLVRHGYGLTEPDRADRHVWISATSPAPHHRRVEALLGEALSDRGAVSC